MGGFQKSLLPHAILLLVFHFTGSSGQEDGFHNFLTIAMQNFPEWAMSRGLEPSPVIPYEVDISTNEAMINITGDIRNQVIYHHTDTEHGSIESDLFKSYFNIRFNTYNFMSIGEYNVEGTVMGSVPVRGKGKFNQTSKDVNLYGEVTFSDFGLTSNGYIDISKGTVKHRVVAVVRLQPVLEGLSAGGYEASVVSNIAKTYGNADRVTRWFPLGDYLKTYFEELFAATPLSEIIGTTLGPPTIPTTTEDPCKSCGCSIQQILEAASTINEEKILWSNIVTDENGQRKRVTTKILKVTLTEDVL